MYIAITAALSAASLIGGLLVLWMTVRDNDEKFRAYMAWYDEAEVRLGYAPAPVRVERQ